MAVYIQFIAVQKADARTVFAFYLQNHEYGFFMLGDTCGSFDTAGQPYPSVLNELDIVEGQCDQNFTLFFSGIEKMA